MRHLGGTLLLLMAGCAADMTDAQPGEVRRYLGYVEMTAPQQLDDRTLNRALHVKSFGLYAGPGVGLGYSDRFEVVMPRECGAYIVVRTQAQLEHLTSVLGEMEGGDLCGGLLPDADLPQD